MIQWWALWENGNKRSNCVAFVDMVTKDPVAWSCENDNEWSSEVLSLNMVKICSVVCSSQTRQRMV